MFQFLQDGVVTFEQMASVVEQYILQRKGVVVNITPPRTDRELQLLGRAYDIASGKKCAPWNK